MSYNSIAVATEALAKINGHMIFGKRLEAQFSKNTSDATHIQNGQFDTTIAQRRRDVKEKEKIK